MWTTLKNRIVNLVAQLTRKPGCKNEPNTSTNSISSAIHSADPGPTSTTVKEKKFDGARMSENRLQALDGAGNRQCYMEKLRQVASDSESPEANREYWFGRDGDSSSHWPTVAETTSGTRPGTPSSTKLAAASSTTTGTASGSNQELTQSGSKIPGIIKAIPTRARITSTQLQAYVESLPKPED
jgi:hypothetical protein